MVNLTHKSKPTQMRVQLSRFVRDYKVPLSATLLFVLLLALLWFAQYRELAAIGDLSKNNPIIANSKSQLVSQDKAAALHPDNDNNTSASSKTQPASPTTSHTAPTTGGSTTISGGPSSGSSAGGTTGGGGTGSSTGEFTADIIRLTHSQTPGPTPPGGGCAINHQFEADITTKNGPGVVMYQWQRSDGYIGPIEQLPAGPGEMTQPVYHNWLLFTTVNSVDEWVSITITSPKNTSKKVTFTHQC